MCFLGNRTWLTGRGVGAAIGAVILCLSMPAGAVDDRGDEAAETNRVPYEYETHALRFEDLVILPGGAVHVGKAMEWSNKILLFDQSGRRRVFDVPDVESFLTRRRARHHRVPERPDLTVAWIERTPRAAPGLIENGTSVRFRVRVLNAGGAASAATTCRILLDSESRTTGRSIPSRDRRRSCTLRLSSTRRCSWSIPRRCAAGMSSDP